MPSRYILVGGNYFDVTDALHDVELQARDLEHRAQYSEIL